MELLRNSTIPSTLHEYYDDDDPIIILHPFVCDDKTSISTYYVCDGMADCQGLEDEKYCRYFNNLYYPAQLCAMFAEIL